MSIEDAFKTIEKHPNKYFIIKALERLVALQTPIEKMVVLVSMDNEGTGSFVTERDKTKALTEKQKINLVFRFFDQLQLPFSYLNLKMDPSLVRLKGRSE